MPAFPPIEAPSRKTFAGLILLGALLTFLSFPHPLDLSLRPWGAPLAWVALAPFFLAIRKTRPCQTAWAGFLFGFLMFGAILYWIALLREAENLKVWGWFALTAIMACYTALFGFVFARLRPGPGQAGSLLTAALWTSMEFLRGSQPFGGFPWGQIGYAHSPSPALLYWTSFTGVWGLTFASAYTAREVAESFRVWREAGGRSALRRLSRPVAVVCVLYLAGGILAWKPPRDAPRARVALLQPNVDQSVKWSKGQEQSTYDILEGLTRTASALRPSLIVWPETAAPSYLLWNPASKKRVARVVRDSGIPALVGCLDSLPAGDPGGRMDHFNAAIAFDGSGNPGAVYRKTHLVPFGEYVPFQRLLAFLGPVVADLGSFRPGPGPARMAAADYTYAPLICYEAIFPRDVRKAASTGADLLVNISNDAWYGKTAALYQHALLCTVQAASLRRPMVRSANTGISLAADAAGRVTARSRWWREEVLVAEVVFAKGNTFFARWGEWFPWGCVGVVVMLLMAGMFRKREAFIT